MNSYAILGIVTIFVLTLGVFQIWRAFKSERERGRAEAERDQHRTNAERARMANEIDEDVIRMSDADLDSELRGWE